MLQILNLTNIKWSKTYVIIGGCVVVSLVGLSAYLAYYKKKKRMIDEGFEDIIVGDDSVKKVLVLGLDGAGKSTFLTQLSKSEANCKAFTNAKGFSGLSFQYKSGKSLNISEIGGSKDIRVYWSNFVQDTDMLVYIVDSSDDHRLAESVKELRILTASDTLKKVPILILANKQDLPTSVCPATIGNAFGLLELAESFKITVHPLEMPPNIHEFDKSVVQAKKAIIWMCCN